MLPINLYDTVRVRLTRQPLMRLDCRVADPLRSSVSARSAAGQAAVELPATEDNLVFRAMQLVARNVSWNIGMHATLVKRIPSAAGLGGASSDAAALLIAARRLIRHTATQQCWEEWGARLGSDVPFFLTGQAGWCRGRGEIVEPILDLPRLDFVLVKPPAGLATSDVYRHVEVPAAPRHGDSLLEALSKRRLGQAGRLLFNRLTTPAARLSPWIEKMRHLFQRTDVLGHQMSGSGTCYFGLCHGPEHAGRVAAKLRSQRPGNVYVVKSAPLPGGRSA